MERKVAPIIQRIRQRAGAGGGTAETAHDRHRSDRSSSTRAAGGFTLIEMLFVLFLVAMITALVAPNTERLYASIAGKTDRKYILDQFASLGRVALRHGQAYVVSPPGPDGPEAAASSAARAAPPLHADAKPYVIDLPEGWTIDLDRPLVVGANGVCFGAEVTLLHEGRIEARLALEAPYCRIAAHA